MCCKNSIVVKESSFKSKRKLISALLLIAMIWLSGPSQLVKALVSIDESENTEYAQENIEINSPDLPKYPTTTDPDFDPSLVEIDNEVIEERTQNSKTFRKIDGTYETAFYEEAIHYLENDKWIQIDNSLIDEGDTFENKLNKYKLKLPKSLDDAKQIKLKLGDYGIDWNIIDINTSTIEVNEEKVTSNNIKDLKNINQSILYSQVQPGVDIEYILTGNQVKENIILNQYTPSFSMVFEYKLKNLDLVQNEMGEISFINDNKEVIFLFSDLIMYDSNNHESYDIDFKLDDLGNKTYRIRISPNEKWLQTAAYPVKIDPSLMIYGSDIVTDKYVFGSMSSSTASSFNKVGLNGSYHYRSYLEFDLTQIPSNIMLNYAYLSIGTYPNSNYCISNCTIIAKEVDEAYTLSQITEEGMLITDSRIIDYEEVNYSDGDDETYRWDLTRNFQKWLFNGDTSRIIELRKDEEAAPGYIILQSENYNSLTGPRLLIGYDDTSGLRNYWTYNEQPVSNAGTGYVSDYTGKLSFSRTDINFSTELHSLSLSMNYNINDKSTNIGYGVGWRTNYNIEARFDPVTNEPYSIDATGTKTYYVPTGCDSRFQDTVYSDYVCYLADDGSRNLYITVADDSSEIVDYFVVTLEQVYYFFWL